MLQYIYFSGAGDYGNNNLNCYFKYIDVYFLYNFLVKNIVVIYLDSRIQ